MVRERKEKKENSRLAINHEVTPKVRCWGISKKEKKKTSRVARIMARNRKKHECAKVDCFKSWRFTLLLFLLFFFFFLCIFCVSAQ